LPTTQPAVPPGGDKTAPFAWIRALYEFDCDA
jgi:hypothetical protein